MSIPRRPSSFGKLRPGPNPEPRGFRPPHCPNLQCLFYRPRPGWRCKRDGHYRCPAYPRPLQRFRCLHCRRTFTRRTFDAVYWLHRYDLFATIAALSVTGAGLRQTARLLGISHTTVGRHLARAGRQALLFHQQAIRDGNLQVRESIAIDGFESFEFSQFFPFHLNLAAGRESWFLYHFTDSPLRRKGRMTPGQRENRCLLERRLGRPDPKAVENAVLELLRMTARWLPDRNNRGSGGSGREAAEPETPFRVESDEHPAYRRAVRRFRRRAPSPRILHHRTLSTAPRTRKNPLFAVNLADLLLRHCGANHRRETIAFSKRRQAAIERMAIFTVWRNFIKWRRENHPVETAAMVVGLASRPLQWSDLFARRRFPRRRKLPGVWWAYYWRRIKTAALGEGQTTHRLRFAF